MRFLKLSLASLAFAIASPAAAQMTAGELHGFLRIEDQQAREIAFGTLNQIALGISSANMVNEIKGMERLFCPPEELAITADQYQSIFLGYLEGRADAEKQPASLVMVVALIDAFPCE
jgi:hypothetical protein